MKMRQWSSLSVLVAMCLGFGPRTATAWFENGHHLIAVLAYEQLNIAQQRELQQQLKGQPRFAEDFKPPADLKDDVEIGHWLIGRAAYWPDVARGSSFDRPTWHYELGATTKIGDPKDIPERPGAVPADATLDSQGMYLSQAIEFCRSVWRDKSKSRSERALALCWLGHIVADSHQPCHSGSLYSPTLFPKGDRGGNFVSLKEASNQSNKNLHLFWDARLGSMFDVNELNRRLKDMSNDAELMAEAKAAANSAEGLDPHTWIRESSELGIGYVYSPEVLTPLTIQDKAGRERSEQLELSEEYISLANRISRRRAAMAATRLAKIWAEGLGR